MQQRGVLGLSAQPPPERWARSPRLALAGVALALCAVLALATGCGGASASVDPPREALVAFASAVRRGDPARVHGLLHSDLTEALAPDDVARLMRENERELADQAVELTELADDVRAEATVPLASGERVRLVLENGKWVIDAGVLGAPALRTPRDAVLALRSALLRRSLAGVERVLARVPRAELAAEIDRIVEETSDELDFEIEMHGNEAVVKTTGGREISLVREAGEWRIVEIR